MYQFFLGLKNYLPAFTPEFTAEYTSRAVDLADLKRRQRLVESIKRDVLSA
jgi:hypothetical protein